MRDPYEVLEIQRGASKDEIKAAYRKLAKQYHPDMHVNNPLKELAQEKFIEIQEAYDQLTNGSGSSYSGQSGSRGDSSEGDDFQAVRQYMNSGNYQQAIYILDNIKLRNAQWNFLMGVCYVNLGSTVRGMQFVKTATSLEPNNVEYSNYLNQISNMQRAYQTRTYNYGRGGRTEMDCCTQLICADCCCECMGGDLISCC